MATSSWSSTPPKGRRRWPTAARCGSLPSCIKCHITPLFRVPWRPRRGSAPIWAETLRSARCRAIFLPNPDLWRAGRPADRLAIKPPWLEPTGHAVVLFRRPSPRNRNSEKRLPRALVRASRDRRTREMMEKVPMTAGGYAALEVELKQRQSVERPRIIEHIAEARSHGDLSENAEYHAAKEEQSHNEGRIAELEDKLARADIIDISKLSGDTIKFGATVTLIDEDTDKKAVWQIVGEPEADAKKGRISITSPLARALIGKKKGTSVEVVAPGGAKAYEITKIEWR